MSTLAERIKVERKRLKLNQDQLAKRVDKNMGQSFISNLETGERVDTPYIPELAHIFGVDAYWLKTGKGNRQPLAAYSPPTRPQEFEAAEPPAKVLHFGSPLRAELDGIVDTINDSGLRALIALAGELAKQFPRDTTGNAAQSST